MHVTVYQICDYSITLSRDFFPLKNNKTYIEQESFVLRVDCYTDGEVKLYAKSYGTQTHSTSFIYKLA